MASVDSIKYVHSNSNDETISNIISDREVVDIVEPIVIKNLVYLHQIMELPRLKKAIFMMEDVYAPKLIDRMYEEYMSTGSTDESLIYCCCCVLPAFDHYCRGSEQSRTLDDTDFTFIWKYESTKTTIRLDNGTLTHSFSETPPYIDQGLLDSYQSQIHDYVWTLNLRNKPVVPMFYEPKDPKWDPLAPTNLDGNLKFVIKCLAPYISGV